MPLDPSAAEMLTFISMAFPDLGRTVHDAAEARAILGQGEAYGARLRAEGGEARVIRVPGLLHGFFGLGDFIPAARTAENRATAILREAQDTSVR